MSRQFEFSTDSLKQEFGLNDRQARFALAKGMGSTNRAAYREAGYKASTKASMDATASALLCNPKVKAAIDYVFAQHIRELQQELHIDKAKILSDLELLKIKGLENGKYGPAVRATELQGKAVGISFSKSLEAHPLDAVPTEHLIDAIAQGDQVLAKNLKEKLGWAKLPTD